MHDLKYQVLIKKKHTALGLICIHGSAIGRFDIRS